MMAIGKTLVPLKLSIMQILESPRSQFQTSGTFVFFFFFNNIICVQFLICCLFICSFYDRTAPIYTQPRYLPPSKMLDADVTNSVIGEGCVIKVLMFK